MNLKKLLTYYGFFAVANVALAYLTSGTKTGRAVGQNALLDFNDELLKVNALAYLLPAGTTGAMLTTAAQAAAAVGPPPILSDPIMTAISAPQIPIPTVGGFGMARGQASPHLVQPPMLAARPVVARMPGGLIPRRYVTDPRVRDLGV
jgi:hypothetical protein